MTASPAPSRRENSSRIASRGRSERCATRAANTSPKSSKIGSATMNASGEARGAPSACAPCSSSTSARRRTRGRLRSLSAEDRRNVLRERAVLQRPVRRDDIGLVAVGAEHPELGVDHEDAVDVGCFRGAAEQLVDRHHVRRRDRFHDVGALRDAFQPRADVLKQAFDACAGKPRLAVEPLRELSSDSRLSCSACRSRP